VHRLDQENRRIGGEIPARPGERDRMNKMLRIGQGIL
jgi:hypothetical protein